MHRYFTQKNDYLKKSEDILRSISSTARDNPFGFGHFLMSLYMYVKRPTEFTVVRGEEPNDDTFSHMLTLLNKAYIPNGIFAYVRQNMDFDKLELLPFFKGKLELRGSQANRSTRAYVCKDYVCTPPIHASGELEKYLKTKSLVGD